jgi:hypothetical protein
MTKHLLCLLVLSTSVCFAQVQTFYVKPIQTDINYSPTEDSSSVSFNTSIQTNKLFLFIGGTGSSSSADYAALRLHAANLGYHCINLSYPNTVAAASLANSNDSLVFDKFRQEVCFGTPLSNDVSVDSLNSIYTRTLKLLQYLNTAYPLQNWGQFLISSTTPDWSKIIISGHSQGAGHACYLAKQYYVDRVLMFSGPNDYSNFYSTSAHWLRQNGTTDTNKHFVYLSLLDETVAFSKQFVNITGLGMLVNDDTTYVDNISSPYNNSHCLYTTQTPGLAILNHNVPIKQSSINSNVWTYMLTLPIITGIESYHKANDFNIFPNPASNLIHLTFINKQDNMSYSIYSVTGQLLKSKVLTGQIENYTIDISDLKTGVYFLHIDGKIKKIIKQ